MLGSLENAAKSFGAEEIFFGVTASVEPGDRIGLIGANGAGKTTLLGVLTGELEELQQYGKETLAELSCRELITFHDGFAYFADTFGLRILRAVEEESGSEASAKELIQLIEEVEHHNLPAIFTEISGSVSAAGILARETGCGSFPLDMAMAGDSYFEAMYHNIDTVKEALG